MERTSLFSVDLYSERLDELVAARQELIDLILDRTAAQPSERGAQKQTDLTRVESPPLRRLVELFVERCAAIGAERRSVRDRLQAVRLHSVVMDEESVEIEAPHCHPGFTYSGVYYVAVPAGTGESGQQGCIDFVSPLPPSSGSYPDTLTLAPQESHLYVFDSWLLHRPHPIETGLRISISLDALFL